MSVGATYRDRKLHGIDANLCTYPGCRKAPADDHDMCPSHRDDARRRTREAKKRKRAEWAAQRLCSRCGGKRAPGRKQCRGCLTELGRTPQAGVHNYVNKRARVAARIVVGSFAKEEGRARYRGAQGRRGSPGAASADAADFADALRCLQVARDGVAYAHTPEVKELPLAQRQEVMRRALSQADHGARFVESILERHRYNGRMPPKDNKDGD